MRIKICGITNPEDARLAVEAGADALGFIRVESSPRYIPEADAHEIYREAGPFVTVVAVVRRVEEVGSAECDAIQFYEGPAPTSGKGIRVFRIKDALSLPALAEYREPNTAILLDTYHEQALGGIGATFDWSLAVAAKGLQPHRRLILAGGLTPDNVAEAVRRVRPYALDVSSGVEASPGKKDRHKLRDFIAAARQAAE